MPQMLQRSQTRLKMEGEILLMKYILPKIYSKEGRCMELLSVTQRENDLEFEVRDLKT